MQRLYNSILVEAVTVLSNLSACAQQVRRRRMQCLFYNYLTMPAGSGFTDHHTISLTLLCKMTLMEVPLIRFAVRLTSMVQALLEFNGKKLSVPDIPAYYSRLGMNHGDVKALFRQSFRQSRAFLSESSDPDTTLLLADSLCAEINSTLREEEKILMLLHVQDCLISLSSDDLFSDFLTRVYAMLGVDPGLMNKFRVFIENNEPSMFSGSDYLVLSPRSEMIGEELEGSWIEKNAPRMTQDLNLLQVDQNEGYMVVMLVDPIKSFVIRCLDGTGNPFPLRDTESCRFMLLCPGTEVRLEKNTVLSYSQIKKQFLRLHPKGVISLRADRVSFRSSKGFKDVNRFSASEESGQIIGILGKEGVGKTTLLKLLAGQLKPHEGRILINGYELWKNKYLLKGVIGYVPEEDLLLEELSVFDNLALTARFYYSNLSRKELEKKIDDLLAKLDLTDLKHMQAGPPSGKHIQPGQRRLLNIALELLREPQILLVDNAVNGLAMTDASKVIKALHEYSFDGNLVITTISQTNSKTFACFDKLWMIDEGGRMAYNGPVSEAAGYLQSQLGLRHGLSHEADPSHLLDLMNYRLPTPVPGKAKRAIDPVEWHERCCRNMATNGDLLPKKTLMPARILKIPNLEVQLFIFLIRNFKGKFTRLRDLLLLLLTGPLIAAIMSFPMRLVQNGQYSFYSNPNIPLFYFLSVCLAVFIGMIISANELIRERNLISKEEYLEFSRFSYINSKILMLLPVLALQVFLYVLTSSALLEIKSMFLYQWIVLFSAGCCGMMMGLFASGSTGRHSVINERIIPVVIMLQILFGGWVIPYDDMVKNDRKYTPLLGDLMISRWGYEALMVAQFRHNPYGKLVYESERELSQAGYLSSQLVPGLQNILARCDTAGLDKDSLEYYTGILQHELTKIAASDDIFPFEYINDLSRLAEDENLMNETSDYLTYLSIYLYGEYERLLRERDRRLQQLEDSLGAEALNNLKLTYANRRTEELVRNQEADRGFSVIGMEFIRKADPIFQEPQSDIGRALLFSPQKKFVNGQITSTVWFNVSIIWLFVFLFYFLLLLNAGKAFFQLSFSSRGSR